MDAKHNAPTVGSLWRHHNGQTYQVVRITNIGSAKLGYRHKRGSASLDAMLKVRIK